jgi:dynein heavy chain
VGDASPASPATTAGRRWPLLVDPQLQGARWVAGREGGRGLVTLQQGDPRFAAALAEAAAAGVPVLVEAMPEDVSPVLEPLLAAGPSAAVAAGPAPTRGAGARPPPPVRIGEADVAVHPAFRLYLQTRLPAPHYPPEVAAQVALVDCSITRAGLEDQLLGRVVDAERPDLAAAAAGLAAAAAQYATTLVGLEDDLLARLAAASGDILENGALVDGLEATKATVAEVEAKAAAAAATAASIEAARSAYRPAAGRGALLYLLVAALPALDRVYHFSMAAFVRAREAPPARLRRPPAAAIRRPALRPTPQPPAALRRQDGR